MNETPDDAADIDVDTVSPTELAAHIRNGDRLSVLDVRNREEADAWPLVGDEVSTHHIPYYRFVEARVTDRVDDLAETVSAALEEPILVICGRGEASAEVAALLEETGLDAANLAEGMNGWGRVSHAVEFDTTDADHVVQFQRPSSGCLSYLVVSGEEALVIDPLRAFVDEYRERAREYGATLVAAVDTHVHADHISGVRDLASTDGVTGYQPAGATARGLAFDAALVAAGETLTVGDVNLDVVGLPGHTTEQVGFRVGDLLFAGDTVFVTSVARPDLESGHEGAPEAARRLHATLAGIDDAVRIAPGHHAPTEHPDDAGVYQARMGALRERIRALSLDVDAFVEHVCSEMPPRPANYEEIIDVNLGIETVTEYETLEQGPNNCAATHVDAD